MFTIIFLVIATVSWLSNREIEKSLARARRSESELQKERDQLEIKVEERTRELKEVQLEKMAQLYRFAEFGRLSTGMFHDLINPLNAVSLNMEKVKEYQAHAPTFLRDGGNRPDGQFTDAKAYVDRAILAAHKMEGLIAAARRQISTRPEEKKCFSATQETAQVIDMLAHQALLAQVTIDLNTSEPIEIVGDVVKFNQIALNLIVNAIDAYARPADAGAPVPLQAEESTRSRRYKRSDTQQILVSLRREENQLVFSVQDHGSGIAPEHMQKIFEPFFTTKAAGKGIGIGLSMTKRIVEKDFGGTLLVKSHVGKGTTFTVIIPTHA